MGFPPPVRRMLCVQTRTTVAARAARLSLPWRRAVEHENTVPLSVPASVQPGPGSGGAAEHRQKHGGSRCSGVGPTRTSQPWSTNPPQSIFGVPSSGAFVRSSVSEFGSIFGVRSSEFRVRFRSSEFRVPSSVSEFGVREHFRSSEFGGTFGVRSLKFAEFAPGARALGESPGSNRRRALSQGAPCLQELARTGRCCRRRHGHALTPGPVTV